jgi:hypothetical protein
MPLKLRASGLGCGIDKDRPDYIVSSGQWDIGRIYQTRGGPENMRWFWSMTVNGPMARADRVATLEEAKAGVKKCWDERCLRASKLVPSGSELTKAADPLARFRFSGKHRGISERAPFRASAEHSSTSRQALSD